MLEMKNSDAQTNVLMLMLYSILAVGFFTKGVESYESYDFVVLSSCSFRNVV